jgi:pimeloyl-ACP methyl ester carboxylesterase
MLLERMSDLPSPWDPFDDIASPAPDPALPEIVLLAGFLGLDLRRADGVRVWLTPESFVLRDVAAALTFAPDAPALVPAGLNRVVYGDLVRELRRAGFTVHAFSFDFRKPVVTLATELAAALAALTALRPSRRFAFVSHSMGALIAAVYPHIDAAWSARVERSIFLGGPLAGTFEAVEAALGTHPIINRLSKLSLRNDPADFAACMRSWPGLYDMLPDPVVFPGGEKAFHVEGWAPELAPEPVYLQFARETRRMVSTSPLFTIPCAQIVSVRYATVDGYAAGPVVAPGPRVAPGDATVSARTATFGGVPAYRVESPHTLLPVDPRAIEGVIELLRSGETKLPVVTAAQSAGPLSMREPTIEEIVGAYGKAEVAEAERGIVPLQDLCWLLAPKGWC